MLRAVVCMLICTLVSDSMEGCMYANMYLVSGGIDSCMYVNILLYICVNMYIGIWC